MLMESIIFQLIRRTLKHHPNYIDIVELLHEGYFKTSFGQCLDLLNAKAFGNFNSDDNTISEIDRYQTIVLNKTAFYSFVMPIKLALFLSNQTDRNIHQSIEEILMEIGEMFQIQDDYLDCFGDQNRTGKIGTDIQEGKCTWLLMETLKRIAKDSEQLKIFNEYYGTENIEPIKEIYFKLELPKLFEQYQSAKIVSIKEKIEQFKVKNKHWYSESIDIFSVPLEQIHQRNR
ncbi:Farnesyl pyrophosphate synthase [Sarcoptes scabiei]|uniref:Farnesyl pyrophosphate synthase n=1 Tax=Sarcoptes scabiei TaxID=52283 RepID=A0A834VDP3_SARSC|nr:Farnesyl pyrophosphate synthase [Sarcoptes scabiei]